MKEATPLEEENSVDVGYESSINDGGMPRCRNDGDAAEPDGDNDADEPSLITSSTSTINGQQKRHISKKSMFALLLACVLISIGACVSIKSYYNGAFVRDRDPLKATEPSKTTRQDPSPDDVDAGNSAAPINGCQEEDEKWFKLVIITDNAGNETSWDLEWMGDGEWRTFSVSKPYDPKQKYVMKMCIPPAEYRFIIRDAGGDGMCCSHGFGSYAGYLRGKKVFESPEGNEDWGERVHTFSLTAGGSPVITTDHPSTSVTQQPITSFPTVPSKTSTPTLPPMQESASPTLVSDKVDTLFPTNLEQSEVPTTEPTDPPSQGSDKVDTLYPTNQEQSEGEVPTTEPTNPPSPLPTPLPTMPPPPPTPPPTDLPHDTVTKIFFIADTPYSDKERYNLMPNHVDELRDEGDFVVHLGDLMYAVTDRCREEAYSIAAQILQRSKMPTFVLPGDNDINDCPSIQHGEDMWMKYFHLFDEKHWSHSFDLTRWGKLNESFGFLHKRVLFLGLNMVGGTPYSWQEKSNRHKEHLEQVKSLFDKHEDNFDVIVLMKHAIPRYPHSDFFGNGNRDGLFYDMIKEMGKPTIHLHGDWHEYYEIEEEYGIANYVRISLDGKSIAPPLSVTIDVSKPNPITVSRRQNKLKVDCCADGWPRR